MRNAAKNTGQNASRNAASGGAGLGGAGLGGAISGGAVSGGAELGGAVSGGAGLVARRRRNIALAVALVLVVLAAFAAVQAFGTSTAAACAVVRDANGVEQSLPLDVDTVLDVSTDAGWNRVVVEGGTVRVEDADCPHRDCVERGAISEVGQQVICLPHQLVVSISGADANTDEAEYDVVSS